MYTEFKQNRSGYVEDMTKSFWCVFFGSQCSNTSSTRKTIPHVVNHASREVCYNIAASV